MRPTCPQNVSEDRYNHERASRFVLFEEPGKNVSKNEYFHPGHERSTEKPKKSADIFNRPDP
jgi:hypothetical protein